MGVQPSLLLRRSSEFWVFFWWWVDCVGTGFMLRVCPSLFYLLWCWSSFIGLMDRSHSDHCRSFFLEETVADIAVDLVFPWYEVNWSFLHHHLEPELTVLLFKSLDAAGLLFLDLYLLFLIIIGINSHNHLNTMVLELEGTQKLFIQANVHSFPNHSLSYFNNRKLWKCHAALMPSSEKPDPLISLSSAFYNNVKNEIPLGRKDY